MKNLPAMQENWVWSLGWEDPLEKGMATHSSILAWEIPWMEEPGRVKSLGSQTVGHDWAVNTYRKSLSIPALDEQWWKLIGPGGVEMVIGLVKCRLLSLMEGMATHSSTLPWRIPNSWRIWREEPSELQYMAGLQRVEHDWSDWDAHWLLRSVIVLLFFFLENYLYQWYFKILL